MSLENNNFKYILLEDETNPNFDEYNNIFKKSQKIEETQIIYKISIIDFDKILYDSLYRALRILNADFSTLKKYEMLLLI